MCRAWVATLLACSACGFAPGEAPDARGAHDGARDDGAGSAMVDAARIDARPIDAPPPPPFGFGSSSTTSPTWDDDAKTITSAPFETTAGDLLALYITYEDAATLTSVTDSAGDVFTIVDTLHDGGNGQNSATAYAANIIGGTITITANLDSDACCRLMIAHEVLGIATDSPLDGHANNDQGSPGTGADAVTSNSLTTTTGGDYIFAGTSNSNNSGGEVITAGAGETVRVDLKPPGGNATATEDQVQPAPGAVISTFTYAKQGESLTMAMAFRPAPPPGDGVRLVNYSENEP